VATIETLGFMDGERVRELEGTVASATPGVIEVTGPGHDAYVDKTWFGN